MTSIARPLSTSAAALAVTLCLATASLHAQDEGFPTEEANIGRGFGGGVSKVFDAGDLDDVNLFNGNLTVTIPVGPTYPVAGGLSYGLRLVYNANVWDHRVTPCGDGPDICPRTEMTEAWPQLDSNAGVGWKLSLGELYPPNRRDGQTEDVLAINKGGDWLYIGPDGARHTFYQDLHHEVADNDADLLYTNDGSYLRLRVEPLPPSGGRHARTVQLPDGVEHRFEAFRVDPGAAPDGSDLDEYEEDWRLVSIRDPFGNEVTVDYVDALDGSTRTWVIRDSHGRETRAFFILDPTEQEPERQTGIYAGTTPVRWLLDRVELPAFDGTTAVWDLLYNVDLEADPERLWRSRHHDHVLVENTVLAPLLRKIVLPDCDVVGGRYECFQGNASTLEMGYYNDSVTTTPRGALSRLQLPTGGRIEWSYGDYLFPVHQHCASPCPIGDNCQVEGEPPPPLPQWGTRVWGVTERRRVSASGADLGTWTYDAGFETDPYACANGNTIFVATQQVTTVTDPLGNQTRSYFSVFQQKGNEALVAGGATPFNDLFTPAGWSTRGYALPFTREVTKTNTPVGDLFLSTEVLNAQGQKVRRTWVRYEQDPPPPGSDCSTGGRSCADTNRRVVASRLSQEVGSRDSGTFRDRELSNFDGLGHFRAELTAGSQDYLPPFTRTVRRSYNADQSYSPSNPDTGAAAVLGLTLPVAGDPWLLNLFDSESIEMGGEKRTRRFCHDPATGFLQGTRVLADPTGVSRRPDDLLTLRQADGEGNVAREELYGGDTQSLPTGSDCPTPAFAATQRRDHTYAYGSPATTWVVDDRDGSPLLQERNDSIDLDTGLVARSKDPAGVETTFQYDGLGRPTSVVESEGVTTATAYQRAALLRAPDGSVTGISSKATQTVEVRDGQGTLVGKTVSTLDDLGRVVLQATDLPGGKTAVVDATYDELGRLATLSEPGNGAPGKDTTIARDLDGRPTLVTRPDLTTVTLLYRSDREVDRTVKVHTGTGDVDATTTLTLDAFGRLVQVTEPSGTAGAASTTTYAHDAGDQLTRVTASDGTTTQIREFLHDPRGLLQCESHPELGAIGASCSNGGAGRVLYSGYDAAGNPGEVITGGVTLRHVYDRAGRAVQIWDQGANRLLRELFYARDNRSASDRSAGKLVLAKAHNLLPVASTVAGGAGQATVTEAYTYGGSRGRLSEVSLRATLGRKFTSTLTYDAQGHVAEVGYPRCAAGGCQATLPERKVKSSYAKGLLTRLEEVDPVNPAVVLATLVSSVTYHPSSRVAELTHGGTTPTKDVFAVDPNGMGRVGGVLFERSGTPLWNLGSYAYDAAGNVVSIGVDSYQYDRVNRLVRGTVLGGTKEQVASYDVFGNLTSLTTGGNTNPGLEPADPELGIPDPVDPATNRLNAATYDARGNVTSLLTLGSVNPIDYDPFNRPVHLASDNVNKLFLYDASGRRVAVLDERAGSERWSLRGPNDKVLREAERTDAGWSWSRDHVFAGSSLVAAETPAGRRHYHLDHLGSTRLVTDDAGNELTRYTYYPFGQLAGQAGDDRLLFTGHERDLNCEGECPSTEDHDDLDYMLARYYSPVVGRFLSVDEESGTPGEPQRWNRYTYASGNPVGRVDPDGQDDLNAELFLMTQTDLVTPMRTPADAWRAEVGPRVSGSYVAGSERLGLEFSKGQLTNFGVVLETDLTYDIVSGAKQAVNVTVTTKSVRVDMGAPYGVTALAANEPLENGTQFIADARGAHILLRSVTEDLDAPLRLSDVGFSTSSVVGIRARIRTTFTYRDLYNYLANTVNDFHQWLNRVSGQTLAEEIETTP